MQLPLIGATRPPQLFDARSAVDRTFAGELRVGYEQTEWVRRARQPDRSGEISPRLRSSLRAELVILWYVVHGVRSPVSGVEDDGSARCRGRYGRSRRRFGTPVTKISREPAEVCVTGGVPSPSTVPAARVAKSDQRQLLGTGSLLLLSSVGSFVTVEQWGMYQFGGL